MKKREDGGEKQRQKTTGDSSSPRQDRVACSGMGGVPSF